MKKIIIGFSKANTLFPIFSWIILFTQGTSYSHVYLKYIDDLGNVKYYQASHTVVNSMDPETFLSQETVIQEFNFQVSDAAFKSWMEFADSEAGKPYGVMEILGLALMEIVALARIKINNPFKYAGNSWICDQLIAAGINQCENIKLPMPLNNMRPQDVLNWVKGLPSILN